MPLTHNKLTINHPFMTVTATRINFNQILNLYQQGQYQEANHHCDALLKDNPRHEKALQLKAQSLFKLNRICEALPFMRAAVAQAPTEPERGYTYGLMCLYIGDFQQGWHFFEYRLGIKSFGILPLPDLPQWQGQSLYQKKILVICEQGFGDCIQFARFLPLLKQRGAHITLVCFSALVNLMKQLPSIDQVTVSISVQPMQFDFAVHLCSLAGIFAANWQYLR
jgi:tetratricopeptide (TPR) repeat protein